MSTTKRICGDYVIRTVCNGEILLDPDSDSPGGGGTVRVDGDLIVTGTQTNVASENLIVADNEIVLNSGESGAGVSLGTAGIAIERGTLDNTYIRYNEALPGWEATDDGTVWYPLDQSSAMTFELVDDLTPQLGGNLDVNGFEISSATNGDVVIDADGTGEVKLNHELSLEEQVTDPAATAGYNKLYAKAVGPGGTGLYTKNGTTEDELVSNEQAIVYSLIF